MDLATKIKIAAKIEEQALYDAYVESKCPLDEIIDLIQNADEWI